MRRLTILVLFLYTGLTVYSILRLVQNAPPLHILPLLTLLAFTFAGLHAFQRLGWKRMLLLLGLCFTISLLFESVGVATGLIYGPYHYTDMLGVKFLGLVPYLIPVAWFMMMYPSLVMAETITGFVETPEQLLSPRSSLNPLPHPSPRPGFSTMVWISALGALIMTAWDLVLDPTMVAIGHWVWDGSPSTRPYFGVPLQNFFGWWLTTFITFILYMLISQGWKVWLVTKPKETQPAEGTPAQRRASVSQGFLLNWGLNSNASFDRLVVLSYLTSALGIILTALIAGIQGPALVGIFAMSPWIIVAWPRLKELVP